MKTNKSLDRDITRKFSFNFPIVHLIRTILQPEIFFYHFNAHRKHLPIYCSAISARHFSTIHFTFLISYHLPKFITANFILHVKVLIYYRIEERRR